jgi:hypothetical protein
MIGHGGAKFAIVSMMIPCNVIQLLELWSHRAKFDSLDALKPVHFPISPNIVILGSTESNLMVKSETHEGMFCRTIVWQMPAA